MEYSRIRLLESKVEQLRCSRAVAKPDNFPSATVDDVIRPIRGESVNSQANRIHTAPSNVSCGRSEADTTTVQSSEWLFLPEVPTQATFGLHGCVLSYSEVVDSFHHFRELYLPHFDILGPVSSLSKLADESKLLLWTIIVIATRYHKHHHVRYAEIKTAYMQLYAAIIHEAIQNIFDLQAVLLLCAWPFPLRGQFRDPS